MILEIKKNLKFLRKKSEVITEITDEVRKLVLEMTETMNANQGVGLAAPQVGYLKRLIVTKNGDDVFAFVNPEVTQKGGKKEPFEEGCLSIPRERFIIWRPNQIKIKALDIEGKEVEMELNGLPAKIFQHEVDHLNGILIIDRISLRAKIVRFLNRRSQDKH